MSRHAEQSYDRRHGDLPHDHQHRGARAGLAMFYVADRSAAAAVVFAEPGDMVLLGAHGLEGLNLRVDLVRRQLIPAGPVPAALVA